MVAITIDPYIHLPDYYQTEPNKNYEDTLLDVKAYADNVSIPYRYILLDSWWWVARMHGCMHLHSLESPCI